jgi:hypothetical protein
MTLVCGVQLVCQIQPPFGVAARPPLVFPSELRTWVANWVGNWGGSNLQSMEDSLRGNEPLLLGETIVLTCYFLPTTGGGSRMRLHISCRFVEIPMSKLHFSD